MDFVIGDLHGCLEAFRALLERVGLTDDKGEWAGDDARLWLLGDYTDRGPDGIGVIELLMRLECEAEAAGGGVTALLGNHDVLLQEAYHFPHQPSGFVEDGVALSFLELWRRARGQPHDLERLTAEHVAWLRQRPALALVGDTLLMHADSDFYLEYGSGLEEINARIGGILESENTEVWDRLEERFASRMAFWNGGVARAEHFLEKFGATRLVHGHTPIYSLLEESPQEVTEPLVYAGQKCINLDGCLYAGGKGFVCQLN